MDLLSFIVSIIPILVISILIYNKDKIKESSKFIFKLFILGISSCYPAAMISSIFGYFFPELDNMSFIQLFIFSFGTIAFIEELCKWIFVYKFSYNYKEFDSSYDMIVYATFVALGFACFENILYVSSYGIKAGLLRGLTAVPGHTCYGILMGIYLGIAKIKDIDGNMGLSKKYKLLSIVIPTIAHGIYDFCIFNGSIFFVVVFAIFIVLVDIYCIFKVIYISKNNIKFKYKDKRCTSCGMIVNSNYCTRCGTKNI